MESEYLPILVLIILAAGFCVTMLTLSAVLGPKKYSKVKDEPFECGTIGTGDPKSRHGVHFYLVAVTFILFDLEIAFLYPWAIRLVDFGWYGILVMCPFFFILVIGLLYEYKRGVLDAV